VAASDFVIGEHASILDQTGDLAPEFDVRNEIDAFGFMASPLVNGADRQIQENTANRDDDEDPPDINPTPAAGIF